MRFGATFVLLIPQSFCCCPLILNRRNNNRNSSRASSACFDSQSSPFVPLLVLCSLGRVTITGDFGTIILIKWLQEPLNLRPLLIIKINCVTRRLSGLPFNLHPRTSVPPPPLLLYSPLESIYSQFRLPRTPASTTANNESNIITRGV